MLIRFFRSAQPLQLVSFIALCVVVWLVGFMHFASYQSGMPFYMSLESLLDIDIVNRLLVLLLLIGQALLVKNIADSYITPVRNSMLPPLVFLVLATSFADWFTLKPYMIANLLLLLLLRKVQVFYRQENILRPAFDAGLLVGVMSFFYLSAAPFFILIWVALATFRPFNWREWLVPVFGLIFPWMIILTMYFVFDGLGELFQVVIPESFEKVDLHLGNYKFYLVALGVSFLPAMWLFLGALNGATVRVSKMLNLIFWMSLLVVGVWLLSGMQYGAAYFLCFPLAIVLSNHYLAIRRKWIAELLFLVLLILQYYERFS